jgi:glycosyltransferase involved in cell wall biosynthesis
MKILFLYSNTYPDSSAPANRVLSLAKGLKECNNDIEISIVYPGDNKNKQNINIKGVYDGIPFKYYTISTSKPKNRILKTLIAIQGITVFFFIQLLKGHRNKPDIIISYSSSFLHIFTIYLLKKIRKIVILREYNEYPKFYFQNRHNIKLQRVKYNLLDGFVFMTENIKNYFNNVLKINKPSVIINMTVDEERFRLPQANRENILTLVGDIQGTKDGVDFLIKSFNKVIQKHPKLKLLLVGPTNNLDLMQNKKQLIRQLNLENNVVFKGKVEREQIPLLLKKSKLLLLPRPQSDLADSGFPTKLGEYLMSTTPVIITDTGEIRNFLKDREDAFICESNNPKVFADEILFALENYEEALIIGKKGKITAQKHFSHRTQGLRLNTFLLSITK